MDQKQRRPRSAMPKPYRPALGFQHFKHEVVESAILKNGRLSA